MTVVNYKIELKPIFQIDFQQNGVSDSKFELKRLISRRVQSQIDRMNYESFMDEVNELDKELATHLMMGIDGVDVVNSLLGSESNGDSLWIEGMLAFRVYDNSIVHVEEDATQLLLESWYQFMLSNWMIESSYIKEVSEWNYNIDWSLQLAVAVGYSDVKWVHED
jgi:hypothetical protein